MEKTDGRTEKGKDGAVIPLPAEYIPAEQNLETIGYFSAGYKRKYPTAKQKSKVIILNHDRRIEIIPTAKYGYPNSDDFDFYRAFLKICHEQTTLVERGANGHRTLHPRLNLPTGFYTRELIRNAGRIESARERQAVRDWIERSTFTGIKGELYCAKTKQFDTAFGGPLFSQFVFVGEKMRNGQLADRNYVWLAPWFLSNCYYHYLRRVDLAFHRRLRKAIAKTLYPLLDTGWYATQGKPYTKRYTDLCALLFIPAHKKLSLVKQQFDPSHEEIKREHFLATWEYLLDPQGKWTGVIRWWPGEKWFQDQEQRKLRKEQAERIDRSPSLPTALPSPATAETPPPQPPLPLTAHSVPFSSGQAQGQHAEMVKDFYRKLGHPRISRRRLEKDLNLLMDLADAEGRRFSPEEITAGLGWIVSHKEDRFAGKVYSLSLLPEVIGEALQDTEKRKRASAQKERQAQEEQTLKAERARRQDLEALYLSLPLTEQAALRDIAVENLLRSGIDKRLLLEPLVRGEIFHLLEERDTQRARSNLSPETVPTTAVNI